MSSSTPPAVLIAFANDDDAHLSLLKKESSLLNRAFSPLHDKGAIEVVREESSTLEELSDLFQRYDRRIALFHYGGHAGGQGLRLEEGDAHAEGLATFFQQQKENIKLVFLNGCSTLPQVKRLMELDIKAVIATSSPIQDSKAVEFASKFYQGLSVGQPLKRAFDSASAMIRSKYEGIEKPAIIEFRSIKLKNEELEQFPWGLYIHEDHKDILKWRLPTKPRSVKIALQKRDYQPNQYLKYVLDAMLFLDEQLREQLTNDEGLLVDTNGNPLNDKQKFYIVLKHLPWPIGAQFQKLVALPEFSLNRLKQIASTYLVTAQTLLYLIISNLFGQPDRPSDEGLSILLNAIDLNRQQFIIFDYLGYIKKLHLDSLFDQEHPPFVKEVIPFLTELNNEKSDLFKAYLKLEELRDSIQENGIGPDQAPEYCEEAEASLTILLSRVAFLVKYKLLAVRDIQIVNYRNSEIRYLHRLGELNGIGDMLGLSPRELCRFTNCDSIILVRDIEDLEDEIRSKEVVNLTPLMIDENAFLKYSTDVINIYMYAYREGDTFFYYKVNSNIFQVIDNEANLLAINDRQETDGDDLFRKFLPIEQSAFLSGTNASDLQATPIAGSKKVNPYRRIVRQMEELLTTLSA